MRDVWRGVPQAMARAFTDAGKELPDSLKPKEKVESEAPAG